MLNMIIAIVVDAHVEVKSQVDENSETLWSRCSITRPAPIGA